MNRLGALGLAPVSRRGLTGEPGTEFVLIQRPLRRILAFTRRSIDDVVNDPIAKNEVLGYFKLNKQIQRAVETRELEHQWNSNA
jgi:hypothetical protein